MALSTLDPGQVLKDAHDAPNTSIKVTVVSSSGTTGSNTIADGVSSSTLATVKAASTAPIAADKALVVAISPNGASGLATAGATTVGTKTGVNVFPLGYSMANAPLFVDYASTPVTSAAYVTLVASLTSECQYLRIQDTSGFASFIAVGAAASEVNQIIIELGGPELVPLRIAAGSRISIKAQSTSLTTGILAISFFG